MTGESRKSRVLLVHRYYKPDSAPYASILSDICDILESKSFKVDILSAQPSYKSTDNTKKFPFKSVTESGARIYRLPVCYIASSQKLAKLLNFVWFPFAVFWSICFSKKYDLISVSSSPPVLLAFAVAVACKIRGSKLIYHCMDIHPEIGKISGEFNGKYVYKVLSWMDSITCLFAAKIIVLSGDMKKSLLKRSAELAKKIEIINNYNLSELQSDTGGLGKKDRLKKRVIYAGNIGRFQNLDTFINALKENPPLDNLELVFLGEGEALDGLKVLAKDIESVKFIAHQSLEVANTLISESDLAIVSLEEGVIQYAYPSKTMTYLHQGTPVLAMVEKESELADFISSNVLGCVVCPGDTDAIYQAYKKVADGEWSVSATYLRKTFEDSFGKARFQTNYEKMINGLIE